MKSIARIAGGLREVAEVLAGDKNKTFKCPDCGTKVLENTGYCVKCKKKVSL